MPSEPESRVVVVGAGNAALCAALAAREAGADVVVLERAPREARGGNSAFTDAAMRFAYDDVSDVRSVVRDFGDVGEEGVDVGSYPVDAFLDDLRRMTGGEGDEALALRLARESLPTMRWLREKGVEFELLFGNQAFRDEEVWRFWGGLIVRAVGGGPGLVSAELRRARSDGVEVRYRHRAVGLIQDEEGRVRGVRVRREGGAVETVRAGAVVLAAGGFEANPEWRARYLGPDWDLARVRGSRYNTGDGLRMALEAGAQPWGHWSGSHAVAADAGAPRFGLVPWSREGDIADPWKRHSYPLGIVVNRNGRRFVDEGADFRNYTYAAYGEAVLGQPGRRAWQIFDGKVRELLRDEYRLEGTTRLEAPSLEELARALEEDGVDRAGFLETARAFNEAVRPGAFDPNELDGKAARDVDPPKSNWALPLDTPPFLAFPVTCAITFTFGGVRVDARTRVLDVEGEPISGLHAAGEMVGGLFYDNYPGGSGLTSGAVFGRTAGAEAARYLASHPHDSSSAGAEP